MKTALRTQTYNLHSASNAPQFTVQPGEEFLAETELCTGGWLNSLQDSWTPEKTCATNPTVCVAVAGAKPGDLLAVDILDITPDSVGYTGFCGGQHPLADRIRPRDWGMNTRTVAIDAQGVHWGGGLVLPLRPMVGTLGTAPATEALSNTRAGRHGGNMDAQEVRPGSRVYLPVAVEGALLHIGDVHAIQGDGEINGAGGIECRSVVKLRAQVVPRPAGCQAVRIEDDDFIMTVGSEKTLEESFYFAADQLLLWMEERYAIPAGEGYLLMGQLMEARCTQFVNPTHTYLCKMPKQPLAQPAL